MIVTFDKEYLKVLYEQGKDDKNIVSSQAS